MAECHHNGRCPAPCQKHKDPWIMNLENYSINLYILLFAVIRDQSLVGSFNFASCRYDFSPEKLIMLIWQRLQDSTSIQNQMACGREELKLDYPVAIVPDSKLEETII